MQRASRVMLVIVLALVLSACGSYRHMGHPHGSMSTAVEQAQEEVSVLVDRVVQDPAKAEEVKARLRQIVSEARESRQQNRQFHQALYDLNRSYQAEPEEFLKILDEMNARRMQTGGNILRLRFEMKDQMTEAEWKAFTDGLAEMRSRYKPEGRREK